MGGHFLAADSRIDRPVIKLTRDAGEIADESLGAGISRIITVSQSPGGHTGVAPASPDHIMECIPGLLPDRGIIEMGRRNMGHRDLYQHRQAKAVTALQEKISGHAARQAHGVGAKSNHPPQILEDNLSLLLLWQQNLPLVLHPVDSAISEAAALLTSLGEPLPGPRQGKPGRCAIDHLGADGELHDDPVTLRRTRSPVAETRYARRHLQRSGITRRWVEGLEG